MATIKAIRTEGDYEAALARIDELMDALSGPEGQEYGPDAPESVELDVFVDLVELYESKTTPMDFPTAVGAIEFNMDRLGLARRDLIPIIGSRSKVSEVLSGKRDITMSMARALHQHLGIPADVLLKEPGAVLDDSLADIEWSRFPLKEMAQRAWIPKVPDLADCAEELVRNLIERAGGRKAATVLYRKNDHIRINAKTDDYALRAWCWGVMARSRSNPLDVVYEPGTVTQEFLRSLAQLSMSEDGPTRARDFLARRGIGLEYLPHLPRTHLDGAALRLVDGRPVIGLTLRYDRIDNFWFTLLHELAHVGLHLDGNDEDEAFVDDHTLRDIEAGDRSSKEGKADQWAGDALIPPSVWEEADLLSSPTPMAVIDVAWEAKVHPAIVAGKVRHERGNYRLLSQFVGTGKVRRQFETAELSA